MALYTDISTGLQTLSTVGVIAGVYDSSALSTPFEIKVQIASFTGSVPADLVIESSANGTFSDAVAVFVTPVPPNVTPAAEVWFSAPSYTLAGASYGSAGNRLRARLTSIAGVLKVRAIVVQ